mmetsp:Transcript_53212/g.105708  ORF Transcript_53212/g.105708 Transcript_53212/m.105708 type:complete len:224 (+) Transcript_53212:474-1145(+)
MAAPTGASMVETDTVSSSPPAMPVVRGNRVEVLLIECETKLSAMALDDAPAADSASHDAEPVSSCSSASRAAWRRFRAFRFADLLALWICSSASRRSSSCSTLDGEFSRSRSAVLGAACAATHIASKMASSTSASTRRRNSGHDLGSASKSTCQSHRCSCGRPLRKGDLSCRSRYSKRSALFAKSALAKKTSDPSLEPSVVSIANWPISVRSFTASCPRIPKA